MRTSGNTFPIQHLAIKKRRYITDRLNSPHPSAQKPPETVSEVMELNFLGSIPPDPPNCTILHYNYSLWMKKHKVLL